MGRSWNCSQVEDELEERDAMDWLEDDEIMRQWEEVSKEEERITRRKGEGREWTAEGVQRVPELVVARAYVERT